MSDLIDWVKDKYYANKPKTLIVGIIAIVFVGMIIAAMVGCNDAEAVSWLP